jgi:hypothetical protein
MSNAPRQVEFTSYSLHSYPPEPIEVTPVSPIYSVPSHSESLSDNLIYVPGRTRRMGYLATDNWLDVDRFRMATGRPPERNFFREIPRDYPTVYRRLKARYHLRPATMAFKAICLSPDVMPEVDMPREEMGNSEEFSRTITEYIREAGIYQPVTSGISLDYLLVSRTAIVKFVQGAWHPSVFMNVNVGKAQLTILERLAAQQTSPYTSPDYNFDV